MKTGLSVLVPALHLSSCKNRESIAFFEGTVDEEVKSLTVISTLLKSLISVVVILLTILIFNYLNSSSKISILFTFITINIVFIYIKGSYR